MLPGLLIIALLPIFLPCCELSGPSFKSGMKEGTSVTDSARETPRVPESATAGVTGSGQTSAEAPAVGAGDEPSKPAADKGTASTAPTTPQARPQGEIRIRPEPSPSQKDANAFLNKEEVVRSLFKNANVRFPPHKILFRVFKAESELEVWANEARDSAFVHVATYPICYHSGDPGPKRAEGDGQVPEGFYVIDSLNKASNYYLSMHVNYPNASDRVLSNKRSPGSAIMIHGNCVSIGCLAMGDENIQELWVMAKSLKKLASSLHVFIAPGRNMAGFIAGTSDPVMTGFWKNIKEGFDLFEAEKRVPAITVDKQGLYHFK